MTNIVSTAARAPVPATAFPATDPSANDPAALDAGPFASARALLAEARACAAEFATAEAAFLRQAVCAVTAAKAERSGERHLKVVVRQGPPLRLRALAFEVAYKARRALDQAAIAAAVALGFPERSGGFPFAPSAALLDLVVARSCAGYDAGLVAHFRSLQPYAGGDDLLGSLGEMAGAMRSQLTVVLGLDLARVDLDALGVRCDGAVACEPARWNPRKRELHVATTLDADAPVTSRVTERTRLPLGVELLGPAVFENRPAAERLGALLDRVDAVVHGIAAETRRLGAGERGRA